MFTDQQLQLLDKPFTFEEHDFNEGKVYIRKSAIRRRLNQVDSAWSLGAPELVGEFEDVVVYRGSLTVCGITKWGLGSGSIIRKKKDGTEIMGAELLQQVAKAHKAAASDILPRAALQFGVGQYITDKPRDVKKDNFATWLAKLPTPAIHWASNGGLKRMSALIQALGLKWDVIKSEIEPGRILNGLGETKLTETAFAVRLAELAYQPANPKEATAAQ